MEYWHEIVKNYDDPNSDGSRSKDHGTLSLKISVILLIYLVFGTDYPSDITKYFTELLDKEQLEKNCPRVLTQPNKISSVIKKMEEDKLVILLEKVKASAAPRSYYVINPQILQSPSKESTYLKSDGSPFEIPPETIEGFLGWMALEKAGTTDKEEEKQVRQERHERADEIFEGLFRSKDVDYASFLDFIKDEAERWDLRRKTNNQHSTISDLISVYIREINQCWDWESCVD